MGLQEEKAITAILPVGKTRNHTNRANEGFSLLELLVVMFLIGLTSLLVLPAMGRRLGRLEVKKSALRLAAVARDLRSKAIYQGSLQRLIIIPSDNSYGIASGKIVRLPSEVRISEVIGGVPMGREMRQFHFYPNGRILGGEIRISGQEGSASYITQFDSLSGRVKVVRGDPK